MQRSEQRPAPLTRPARPGPAGRPCPARRAGGLKRAGVRASTALAAALALAACDGTRRSDVGAPAKLRRGRSDRGGARRPGRPPKPAASGALGSIGTAEVRAAFGEANDLYLAGDFARAGEAFRRLARLGPFGTGTESAWAVYRAGRCDLALGRLSPARSSFLAVLETTGAGPGPVDVWAARGRRASPPYASTSHASIVSREAPRAANGPGKGRPGTRKVTRRGDERVEIRAYALSGLADVSLAQKRPAEALMHLARIRTEGLAGRLAARGLLFRRAAALEALGRRGPAARAFARLAGLWPESDLAAEARARAEALGRNRLPASVDYSRSSPSATAGSSMRGRPGGATSAGRSRPGTRGRHAVVIEAPTAYRATAAEFARRESAELVAGRLRAAGLRAEVRAVRRDRGAGRGGEARYLVWLGEYEDRARAQAKAVEARSLGFPAEVTP